MNLRMSRLCNVWSIAILLANISQCFADDPVPAAEVNVVGRKDESDLEFTTQLTSHEQTIALRSISATEIEKLTVSSTQSSGPDGIQRSVKVTFVENGEKSISLPSKEQVNLNLRTDVPLVGSYKGVIILDDNKGKIKEISFKITRVSAVFAYDLLPKKNEAVRQDLLWRSNTAKIRYGLHEKNGKEWKGKEIPSVPELIGLTTKISDKTPHQTLFKRATWVEEKGSKPIEQKFELAAGETKNLILNVSGIQHAGEHVGTLIVANPDGQTKEYEFTIYARRNFLFAVLAIILGIGCSLLFRRLGTRRTRLNLQIQLAPIYQICLGHLNQPQIDQRSRAIFMHLKERILTTYSSIETSPLNNYQEVISELQTKTDMTEDWDILLRLAKLTAPIPKEIKDLFREVEKYLIEVNSATEKLVENADKLNDLEDKIDQQIKNSLLKTADELSSLIKAYEISPRLSEQSVQTLANLSDSLDMVRKNINQDSTEETFDSLKGVEVSFVELFVDDLLQQSDQLTEKLNPHVTPEERAKFQSELASRLSEVKSSLKTEPDNSLEEAFELRANYYLKMLSAACNSINKQISTLSESDSDKSLELEARLESLKNFKSDIDTWMKSVERSPEELFEIELAIQAFGSEVASPARYSITESHTSVLQPLPKVEKFSVLPQSNSVQVQSEEGLRMKMRKNECRIICLTLIVAIISGIKLLWLEDITWGSADDFLIAFLWGLGLHQVSGGSTFIFQNFSHSLLNPPAP